MSSSNPPNLLVLHAHDLGRHLGCHGIDTVHTPHIDRLAGQGIRLDRHFCTSPGCSPSRAALWTGCYPHRTGVLGLTHSHFRWSMNADHPHLAAHLGKAGYETALAGLFHEDRTGDRLGYEQFLHLEGEPGAKYARDIADAAIQFISSRTGDNKQPFFLSIGLFEPHRPFDYGGVEPDRSKGCHLPPYIPQETEAQRAAAEEDFAGLQGAIRELDQQVGRILDQLDASGLADHTLVVFTSDHGIAMPRAKCSLYDPGIEIPLILRAPFAGLEGGKTWSGLSSNIDVVPTVLEILGIAPPDDIDGASLCGPILGNEGSPHEAIFAQKTFHKTYDPIRCIRTETHKLIINFEFNTAYDAPSDILASPIFNASAEKYCGSRPEIELYDLRNDPWEAHNLAEDNDQAALRDDLTRQLLEQMRLTGDPVLDGPVPSAYHVNLQQHLATLA